MIFFHFKLITTKYFINVNSVSNHFLCNILVIIVVPIFSTDIW